MNDDALQVRKKNRFFGSGQPMSHSKKTGNSGR
jgi:hypothetical protein